MPPFFMASHSPHRYQAAFDRSDRSNNDVDDQHCTIISSSCRNAFFIPVNRGGPSDNNEPPPPSYKDDDEGEGETTDRA
jgi:hypothetical protein